MANITTEVELGSLYVKIYFPKYQNNWLFSRNFI